MSDNLRLSVSKTKTFLDCKKKFEFSYIYKLPKKDRDFHIFGKFCHDVLEHFHLHYINGGNDPFNTVMTSAFKEAMVRYKEGMTPEMKKECWGIIDRYLRDISANNGVDIPKVLSVEERFDFPVSDNLVLNGAIDRIQMDDDGILHVCDYKTTKNKKYLKNDWFQLLTYAYVLLEKDPSIKQVRGSYILLRHDFEYVTNVFNLDQILETKEKYLKYAEQIRNEKEYKANPTPLCGWCDFATLCKDRYQSPTHNVHGEVNW